MEIENISTKTINLGRALPTLKPGGITTIPDDYYNDIIDAAHPGGVKSPIRNLEELGLIQINSFDSGPGSAVTGAEGGGAATDIDALETDVTQLQTDVGTAQTDIGTLQTDVGTAQTDIGTLQTDVGTAQGDATQALSDAGAAQADATQALTDSATAQSTADGKDANPVAATQPEMEAGTENTARTMTPEGVAQAIAALGGGGGGGGNPFTLGTIVNINWGNTSGLNSGTVTVNHNLGALPQIISSNTIFGAGVSRSHGWGQAVMDGTGTILQQFAQSTDHDTEIGGSNGTALMDFRANNGNFSISGTLSNVTTTQFDITWLATSGPGGNPNLANYFTRFQVIA